MDILGRQNIQAWNVYTSLQPCERVKLIFWYYLFHLDQRRDALYNAMGRPIYHDPTGNSGSDVGRELDILVQWTLTPRSNLTVGYSHFWAGDYFDSPVIRGGPADAPRMGQAVRTRASLTCSTR